MRINIADPVFQTTLFIIFFALAVIATLKRDTKPYEMDHAHTDELKGVAILMVVFSHIGYFLFEDTRFMLPLSIAAGVGVNIFLFLSGFGLTSSELKVKKTWREFYAKRLKTIFVPMWIALIAILALDYFLIGKTYELSVVIKSFFRHFHFYKFCALVFHIYPFLLSRVSNCIPQESALVFGFSYATAGVFGDQTCFARDQGFVKALSTSHTVISFRNGFCVVE